MTSGAAPPPTHGGGEAPPGPVTEPATPTQPAASTEPAEPAVVAPGAGSEPQADSTDPPPDSTATPDPPAASAATPDPPPDSAATPDPPAASTGSPAASTATPAAGPAAPARLATRPRPATLWAALALVAVGAGLIGDPAARLGAMWSFVWQWWPWLLLGLALVNIGCAVLRVEAMLGPGLLAAVALVALAARNGIPGSAAVVDIGVPVAIALAGVLLALSTRGPARSWTRLLTTGTVQAPRSVDRPLRPTAILGEVRADLRPLHDPLPEVHVTAFAGHVRLTIPADWQVDLKSDGALLTSVRGSAGTGEGRPVTVRLLTLGAIVSFTRVERPTSDVAGDGRESPSRDVVEA